MSGRKKIAIVTPHHWSGSYGGAEYQISLLVGELAKNHPELELHYLCNASENHITPDDHTIHTLPAASWYNKYGTFFDGPALYRMLSELKPDFIYQRVGCSFTGVCARYARKNNVNMVWHIALDLDVRPERSGLIFSKPHHWLEKKLLEYGVRNSPMIVAQKQSQADDLKRFYNRHVNAIIANFQPAPDFQKDQDATPHIVWISNHKKEKNPEIFIDLAERLSEETSARFTMAGRPAPTEWGQRVVQRAEQSRAINFVGELKQEDLNTLLETAHVMVNTSDYEGFPNTFIQSWMREVPVVSLYVDPDDVLSSNGIGSISGDIEKLYINTLELIKNREKRLQMATAARDYATRVHSLANAEEVVQLLTSE